MTCRSLALMVVLSGSLLGACTMDEEHPAPPPPGERDSVSALAGESPPVQALLPPLDPGPDGVTDILRLEAGALRGAFGTVTVDGVPYRLTGETADDHASVALFGDGGAGGVPGIGMFGLRLDGGGLDHPRFATGEPTTYFPGDPPIGGLLVHAIACSGTAEGRWSYDRPATELTVRCDRPGAAVRTITFSALFDDGTLPPQRVEGNVSFRPY